MISTGKANPTSIGKEVVEVAAEFILDLNIRQDGAWSHEMEHW